VTDNESYPINPATMYFQAAVLAGFAVAALVELDVPAHTSAFLQVGGRSGNRVSTAAEEEPCKHSESMIYIGYPCNWCTGRVSIEIGAPRRGSWRFAHSLKNPNKP
jgi:hypothetical protein